MNQFLAELYGTADEIGSTAGNDVEKLAEAQILDEFFTNEGIDVDKLDGGTIVKVAHELFGDDSAIVKQAEGEGDEPPAKKKDEDEDEEDMEEKSAQADYLGRVMAHAFNQEDRMIKEGAGGKAGVGAKALKYLRGAKKGVGREMKGMKHTYDVQRGAGPGMGKGRLKALVETAKKHPKGAAGAAAAGAAGLGAAGGGAYALGKKKSASALDALAESRAVEMLNEAGIGADNSETKLAEAVEQRAVEMLAEAGYLEE